MVESFACDQLLINMVIVNFSFYTLLLFANPAHQYSISDVSELQLGGKKNLYAEDLIFYLKYRSIPDVYFVLDMGKLRKSLRPGRGFLYVTLS